MQYNILYFINAAATGIPLIIFFFILIPLCIYHLYVLEGRTEREPEKQEHRKKTAKILLANGILILLLISACAVHALLSDMPKPVHNGDFIIYTRADCEDCQNTVPDLLTELDAAGIDPVVIDTDTKAGKKMLERYPAAQVPMLVYVWDETEGLSWSQDPCRTDENGESAYDPDKTMEFVDWCLNGPVWDREGGNP